MAGTAALAAAAFLSILSCTTSLYIGVGRADMTGPAVEVAFMGYANPEQRGRGIHLRQFARAFIIDDGNDRLVFVSADAGMIGTYVRQEVIKRLTMRFGPNIYTEDNVMISGTHTHSAPGGFLFDTIFDLNTMGFVKQTFYAYVDGIVRSIERAHYNMENGTIKINRGYIKEANINRSPASYLANPKEERDMYDGNTDSFFLQLSFSGSKGQPRGAFTWFAVHGTSMNNTNLLISSDNVGLASIMFEQKVNKQLPGMGEFVAAFASTNLGDVSPNIAGPRCHISNTPCDPVTSTCANAKERCVAFGPGKDMVQSTEIIAKRIFDSAYRVWKADIGDKINGSVNVRHQYVDMANQKINITDPITGANISVKGCSPAMGYSFAAGTTDGPGMFDFKQGTKTTNPLWNIVTDILAKPSPEMIACHSPKPILLATGKMHFPFEWQPSIVSTHLARVGKMVIACVPGEFTTMAGRRMRTIVGPIMAVEPFSVIIAGLCNTYADYITTPEEYTEQRYEGASTIFGPHTLDLYLKQYAELATHIMKGTYPKKGPEPPFPYNKVLSFLPGVIYDTAGWRNFGDVIKQPPSKVLPTQVVSATFVAGNPRNDLLQESSFLAVERMNVDGSWSTVANDASWETRFIWTRNSSILGTSQVEVRWHVPLKTRPGKYRITHRGSHKNLLGGIHPYIGTTRTFEIPDPTSTE